jgi:hypothetical protein
LSVKREKKINAKWYFEMAYTIISYGSEALMAFLWSQKDHKNYRSAANYIIMFNVGESSVESIR